MFHHPAWAVGSYSSGPPAGGTPQIQVNKTQSARTWDALYTAGSLLQSTNLGDGSRLRVLRYFCQHAPVAESSDGAGGSELRLCVLAEEGGDAGELTQVLGRFHVTQM